MSAHQSEPVQTITARVEAANERGYKLAGAWYNLSRYARPGAVQSIERGQAAVATIAGDRWLVGLRPATTDEAATLPPAPAPVTSSRPRGGRSPEERREIVRLATLRDAASFLASTRPDASPADVLELAATFEAWVGRPGGE